MLVPGPELALGLEQQLDVVFAAAFVATAVASFEVAVGVQTRLMPPETD